MIMLFRRKEILDQINEELKLLDAVDPAKDPVRFTIAADKVTTKEIRKVGNGAYVMRTWHAGRAEKRDFSDLTFRVSEHTFESSKGYSVDVMEGIAGALVAIRLHNQMHR